MLHVMDQPSKRFCTGALAGSGFSTIPKAADCFELRSTHMSLPNTVFEKANKPEKNPPFIKRVSTHQKSFKHSSSFMSLAS